MSRDVPVVMGSQPQRGAGTEPVGTGAPDPEERGSPRGQGH